MQQDSDLLEDWAFEVGEVSAGVYRVEGSDGLGRSVQYTGDDVDALLKRAKKAATRIMRSSQNEGLT